jgi:hypothetical protein
MQPWGGGRSITACPQKGGCSGRDVPFLTRLAFQGNLPCFLPQIRPGSHPNLNANHVNRFQLEPLPPLQAVLGPGCPVVDGSSGQLTV